MKIIHISDLHFGRENPPIVSALLTEINTIQPNLVIISGDLTQRARKKQFLKCAQFLKQITVPILVVPGNHDIPLYDVVRRFLAPITRYRRYITKDLFPTFENDQIIAMGINSAHSFTWDSGRVTVQQLRKVAEKFASAGQRIKMLVVHHPFRELFVKTTHHQDLNNLGVDIILSGHLHQAFAQVVRGHSALINRQILIVQAGTTVSTRLRGENNSYNLIEVSANNKLVITTKEYQLDRFNNQKVSVFQKTQTCWQRKAAS